MQHLVAKLKVKERYVRTLFFDTSSSKAKMLYEAMKVSCFPEMLVVFFILILVSEYSLNNNCLKNVCLPYFFENFYFVRVLEQTKKFSLMSYAFKTTR